MIRLESVTKRYGSEVAVDSLSMEIGDGELCVLVGPSGCGKTTTMKMINRLIEPTSGTITLDGRDIMSQSAVELRRHIGYVIQQVGLFPHLTVADNVATVPRLLGWDRGRTAKRVNELLELVGLPPGQFAKRYPNELSGGQRQRAGVARALAADPPVLLMDEPFGAIDPITRDRLQGEFLRLQREVRKTIVFVTHDIEEAVRLGDRIAILAEGGLLQQYDTPAKILGTPATPFVADFVGADRGLRRLTVTAIEGADLDRPPVVHVGDSLTAAREAMDRAQSKWAVVVDEEERLRGWIGRDVAAAAGGGGSGGDAAGGGAASSGGGDAAGGGGDPGGAASSGGGGAASAGDRAASSGGGGSGAASSGGGGDAGGDGTVGARTHRMEAWVPLGATLKQAFSEMLQHDAGWVAVLDGDRFVGVLTPESLHGALRRSVDDEAGVSVEASPLKL